MWTSVFVILAIGGTAAAWLDFSNAFGNCDTSKCENDIFGGIELEMAPNEEQLKAICGPMVVRRECIKTTIEECEGKDLEELSASENTAVALHSRRLLGLYRLIIDICDEDSFIHKGYVSSVECLNDMVQKPSKCHKEAISVYGAYVQSQKLIGIRVNGQDSQCVIWAYTLACFSVELKEHCGEVARVTMVEMLKSARFLTTVPTFFSPNLCSKDQVEKLKTIYLDFMDLEEQEKLMFYQIFDTGK